MNEKWEYAVLERLHFNVEPPPPEGEVKEQTIAAFGIRYADGSGKMLYCPVHQITTKNVSDKSKNLTLLQVAGLLGAAGWELVTLDQQPDRLDICTVSSMYFKRPMLEGRAVDEPHIDVSFPA